MNFIPLMSNCEWDFFVFILVILSESEESKQISVCLILTFQDLSEISSG